MRPYATRMEAEPYHLRFRSSMRMLRACKAGSK